MAIAKRSVDAHAGTIEVVNGRGGAEFRITLPKSQMTRPLKIVIADDEEDIRYGLRRLLTKLGYDVVGEAANGRELVEVCMAAQPDLVITDIRMPEKSGIEAAAEIVKTQKIPFIVVSSYERQADAISGCITDFLQKPVCSSELQAAIARACPNS